MKTQNAAYLSALSALVYRLAERIIPIHSDSPVGGGVKGLIESSPWQQPANTSANKRLAKLRFISFGLACGLPYPLGRSELKGSKEDVMERERIEVDSRPCLALHLAQSMRLRMAGLKLLAAMVLVLATVSFAPGQVPDCAPGKLSDYEKLGATGCLIGDKRFSNFQYRHGPDGLPGESIEVTPGTVPESDSPGLLFEARWVAPSYRNSFVSYTVEVLPNGKPITGASLEMQFGEITGTGEAQVTAELCPLDSSSGSCGTQELDLKVMLNNQGSKKASDKGQFRNALRGVRVLTPLIVASGKDGSASLNGFMTVFR